ncbi:sigma-70 family RNA polymerase sigma factor [Actinoallomurus acaciae]|uniref:Sigma-70 family RNA polymerase sigma factor n=1 Tax=Actinoallomurus acaciae TaxID=502577 RepID=A0ABV5YAW5_9ACTN
MRVAARNTPLASPVLVGAKATRDAETADEDDAWVRGLTATGPERERTVASLYRLLLGPARAEACRLGHTLGVRGPEIDDIASQATADAVVAILRKASGFRGDARFTTWAHRFVLNEVAGKVSRHFWRRPVTSLEAMDRRDEPAARDLQPEIVVEVRDLLTAVARVVDTALTERQRTTLLATALDGASPAALGSRRNVHRNTVYKVVFDARRKLRSALAAEGYR